MSEVLAQYRETDMVAIVAGNVRARAARLGFNQSSLAARLGTAQSVISKKWRGERAWKLDDLDGVARVLQCAPWDLTRPDSENGGQSVSRLTAVPYTARDSNPEPIGSADALVRRVPRWLRAI